MEGWVGPRSRSQRFRKQRAFLTSATSRFMITRSQSLHLLSYPGCKCPKLVSVLHTDKEIGRITFGTYMRLRHPLLLNCFSVQRNTDILLMDFNADFPANARTHYCYRPFYRALCSLAVMRHVSNTRYCLTGLVQIIYPRKIVRTVFPVPEWGMGDGGVVKPLHCAPPYKA